MINTSDAYKKAIKKNRILYHNVEIAFADGSTESADNLELFAFQIADGTSNTGSFDIGAAIAKQLTIKLNNVDGKFDKCDFSEAVITAKVGLELPDGKIEWLDKGTYIAEPGTITDNTITVNAFDFMTRFDKEYSASKLEYPTTLGQIVRDACSCCNVTLAPDTASFENDNFIVQERPDDSVTFRQILQWVGQIACKYSRINSKGKLSLQWYDVTALESDWTQNDNGVQTDQDGKINTNIAVVDKLSSGSSIETDDVVITGIKVTEEAEDAKENVYMSGADGYVLSIEGNKLIQNGKGATVASFLGKRLNGLKFRTLSVNTMGNPAIEAGDLGLVTDRKGRDYKTIFTDVTYAANAAQNLMCGAEAPTRRSSVRYSQATQVYKELRKKLQKQKSAVEASFENLKDAMKSIKGLYPISEQQQDGSFILYLCDKPTLKESQVVIKMNAEGWGMSTDGGKTWNVGALVDGTTITKLLNAIGINAEWINAGTIKAVDKDGNTTFLVDMDTGQVSINANLLQIKGKDFSSISKDQLDDFINNTYLSDILGIKSRLDGKIETWYQDKDPSLEWTRIMETPWLDSNGEKILDSNGNEIILFWESEKAEHEGDLWYNTADNSQWTYISGEWQPYSIPDDLLDKIDGKCTVYMQQPKPPYNSGDLWVITDEKGKTSLKTSVVNRVDGDFVPEDWIDFKYVDADDVADAIKNYDTSLGQPEIFNKLTNGGKEQGIYIKDGKLYINATYILSGTLAGNLINGRGLKVIDDDKKVTVEIDSKGNVSLAVTNFSLKGKSVEDIASEEARKRIEELPRETENLLKGYGLAKEDVSKYWDITGTPAYSQADPVGQSQALQLSDLSAGDVFFSSKVTENPISAVSGRYNISFWLKGNGTVFTDYTYAEVEVYFNGALLDTARVQYWKKYSYSIDVSKMNSGSAKLQLKIKGFTSIKHNICIYRPQVTFGYTSLDIFNMLTNNGAQQGIYMIDGKLMLNGEYIKALSVAAEALAANSVTTEKLLAGAVTAEKITIKELSALGASLSGFKMDNVKIYIYSEEQGASTGLVISRIDGNIEKPYISFGMGGSADSPRLKLNADGIVGADTNALDLKDDTDLDTDQWQSGRHHNLGKTEFNGDVTVHADFKVTGTKSIVAKTQNYGSQAFYCYETPTPTLGDFGGSVIGEDGLAVILIDDILRECTDTEIEYYVFLQREGAGDAWVSEKTDTYFSVRGTPGLHFAWELKARQLNKEYIRFNAGKEDREVDFKTVDLEKAMFAEREKIIMEMEGELA